MDDANFRENNILTAAQRELLTLLHGAQIEGALCPSYDELGEAMGCVKSRISALVEALEERGFVRRLPTKARSIIVLRDIMGAKTDVGDIEESIIDRLHQENLWLRNRLRRYEDI